MNGNTICTTVELKEVGPCVQIILVSKMLMLIYDTIFLDNIDAFQSYNDVDATPCTVFQSLWNQ